MGFNGLYGLRACDVYQAEDGSWVAFQRPLWPEGLRHDSRSFYMGSEARNNSFQRPLWPEGLRRITADHLQREAVSTAFMA